MKNRYKSGKIKHIMSSKRSDDYKIAPPLKWAGGKRWLVPHLLPIWAKYRDRRLVEPFAGALAVTLGLMPKKAWANDINVHLVNFYNQLKKGLITDIDFKNDKDIFYQCRTKFNQLIAQHKEKSKEAAELFYFLNRTAFNGLCRFNRKGEFNVPFGKYKTIRYTHDFTGYKSVFKNWRFTAMDFEKIKLEPDDFIYADPPYDVQFTTYSSNGFSWHDQIRTAKWLAKHPGPVILSNQATERILELYKSLGFTINTLKAPRMISCTGNRDKALEVLATKNIEIAHLL